jgi:putative spermidine/putrescine transport system permease protein
MIPAAVESSARPASLGLPFAAMRRVRWELLVIPLVVVHAAFFVVPQLVFVSNAFFVAEGPTLVGGRPTLANFAGVLLDPYYQVAFLRTAWVSALTALACLVVGYPVAYVLSRARGWWTTPMLMIVMSSVFVSLVVRTLGWKTILDDNGPVVSVLRAVPLVGGSVKLLNTSAGIVVGLVHTELPFMILTLLPVLQAINPALEEAAAGLGAGRWRIFTRVLLPLSLPGVLAGSLLVFSVSMGLYVPPALLGGNLVAMVPILIYSETMVSLNYPMAAALSVVLAVVVVVTVTLAAAVAGRTVRGAALRVQA